jgi:hypothetical protein
VSWAAVLAAFFVSHLAGDFLLQTEWQAVTKPRGLSRPAGRRALSLHTATYMLAFLPALAWVATDRTVLRAIVVALLIALPHVVIDDGRLVKAWLRDIKHVPAPSDLLAMSVDQSFHAVCLLGAALVAAA